MSPLLLQLQPDTSTAFTATVVIAGIFIVVAVLFLLILVFQAFGKGVSGMEARAKAKSKKPEANKNQKIPMPKIPEPIVPVVEDGIPEEVVAAIAGAIAACEGPGAVVRSIKKKNVAMRNPWAQAAQINNTRPF